MAVSSPYLFSFQIVEDADGHVSCTMLWSEAFGESSSAENYILSIHNVFYYILTALLIIVYSIIIIIKLKNQKIPGEQSNNAEEQRAKRNRNVLNMAIAIVVGFLLCWIPYSIITLLLLSILWLSQIAPSTLASVLFLVGIIARDLKDS